MSMNGLFWRTEQDTTAWESACGRAVSHLFGSSGTGNDADSCVQVVLKLPTAEAAKDAWNQNCDLLGDVTLTLGSPVGAPLRLAVPLPLDGVFIARRQDSDRPLSLIWGAWLGEAPGFRLVRPTSQGRRDEIEWRVGLPRGYFVGAPCRPFRDLSKVESMRLMEQRQRLLCNSPVYPEWLRPLLGNYGPRGASSPKTAGKAWREIHEAVLEKFAAGELSVSDQDDLNHRVLVTFPVWLIGRICDELLRAITTGLPDRKLTADVVHAFRAGQVLDADRRARVWSHLIEKSEVIAARLVPLRRTHISDKEAVDQAVGLHCVDPANPVDMVARLTRVKRLPMKSGDMGELPAEYRQNHPSFRGRLCPVISPESELVGLTLQLAEGATVDYDGRIHPGSTDDPISELGYGAGLIPFFQHNDGTRNMMGAKNLRQGLPVAGRKAPAIRTGGEESVMHLTSRLTEIGLCPPAQDDSGALAMGVDLLVAYLPWHGMNFEDAIVVGQQVFDAGTLDVAIQKRVRRQFKAGWAPRSPDRFAIFEGLTDGLARPGDRLTAGSMIASFACGSAMAPVPIRYNDRSPAVLKSIRFECPQEWMGGTLEYELEKRIPLGIGDKLMGRHGNKGVVGAIVAKDAMPRLPDDPSLPEALRGRTIDILLNPHGVISRMNIGQLLETHIGWLLHSGKCAEIDLLLEGASADRPIGYPFAGNINHEKVRDGFKKTGLDETGRIQLLLPSGEKTLSPVVVGFQHIVRLRHIPELKAQARRGGVGASYSRKTGQAVHGRVRGGGQRIGEMEVWSLAGHQAEHILEEMLGVKADADWAAKWLGTEDPPTGDLSNGFAAMMNDWLFALLVKAETADNQVRMSIATPEEVVDRVGADHRVETGGGLRKFTTALFCCHAGKKDATCGFSLPVQGRIAVQTSSAKDGQISSLKLGDLLVHLGVSPKGPVTSHGNAYKVCLQSLAASEDSGALLIQFSMVRDQLKAVIHPGLGKERPSAWPQELDELFAYGRFADSDAGKNVDASALLSELMDASGKHTISDLRVTCPRHKTVPLKASPPFGEVLKPDPRGLFDTTVFGSLWARGGSWSNRRWGYIELPVEVRYPLEVCLSSLDTWQKQSKKDGEKKALRFLEALGLKAGDAPLIRMVPVLPSHYRMPLVMTGEPIDDPLVERGYRPLIAKCGQYQDAKTEAEKAHLIPQIEQCVANLFALLTEGLRNKTGLIRTNGLGRRVDRSARLVIAPNPLLKWDQVGVPAAVLLELLGDRIKIWMDACGRSDDLLALIKAVQARQNKSLEIDTWSWWRSSKDEELVTSAKKLIDDYLGAHPDTLVLLNRQPSLHRDSFQAFYPQALGPESGDTLQICPLTCKGFAADFDGDEMVVHLPVSNEAQEEATRMLPSRNLFSMASGEVMAHFDQDFVLGSYWLMDVGADLQERFLADLPADCCRALVRSGRISKKEGSRLLEHLAHEHPDCAPDAVWKWMNTAFECCTRVGVSFGFYDLLDLKKRVMIKPEVFQGKTTGAELEDVNSLTQKIVEHVLTDTFSVQPDWKKSGLHFAAMAMSGARGKKQTRQIVGARGFLNPGATGFSADLSVFAIRSSLVDGMNPDEAFWAAMNARSSMCDKKLGTGHAGDLTRHLVFALWPFTVTCVDCGSCETRRSVLTCKAEAGCCSTCYGPLPNGAIPAAGFPVGLIAAQSIGERGTQLSMQSFHTGQRAFTISDVRRVLGHGDEDKYFENLVGAERFIAALKASDAYASLQDRHFHVLWKVIQASPDHTLRSAIKHLGAMSRIAFQSQSREIAAAALTHETCSLVEPVARVLYGLFGGRAKLIGKG